MGWAAILLPDAHGDEYAKRVWTFVYRAGFCSMLFEGDNRPHVTLTLLETQDGSLPGIAARFAAASAPITVTFASIGSFGEDVIYLEPQPTAALHEMNRRLTAELGPLATLVNPHYLPGVWTPHMTAAFKIAEGDFPRAMWAVRKSFVPFTCAFESVAVVKFSPVKIVGVFRLGALSPTPPPCEWEGKATE